MSSKKNTKMSSKKNTATTTTQHATSSPTKHSRRDIRYATVQRSSTDGSDISDKAITRVVEEDAGSVSNLVMERFLCQERSDEPYNGIDLVGITQSQSTGDAPTHCSSVRVSQGSLKVESSEVGEEAGEQAKDCAR